MTKLKKELQKNRRKKTIYTIIAAVSACVAVGAVVYLVLHVTSLKKQENIYDELRQTEQLEQTEQIVVQEPETETCVEVATETEEMLTCESVYDFVALHETNEDIYAWITIPGTLVDYPVLQSEVDNYYLDRNLDHSTGYPGCIYTNSCNAKDFSDLQTVLYGHNMKNDSMFGSLHDYENQENFETNRYIYVYTEEKRLTYEIYGAVKFTDAYITSVYGTNSIAGNGQFLQDIAACADEYVKVSHLADMDVAAEDKLITLSTCISGEATKRYIIVGVLVEEAFYKE